MTTASKNKFFLETSNVLGFEYESYVQDLTSLALSDPSKYFALRKTVIQSVKYEAVKDLYATIFSIMSEGSDTKGNNIMDSRMPKYPSQKINDISMRLASMLSDELNEILEIILPSSFDKLSSKSLTLKGKASILN